MLDTADAFYLDAINELDVDAWADLSAKLEGNAPTGIDADTWAAIQGAHQGHQAGLSLLLLLPALAQQTGFYELEVNSTSAYLFRSACWTTTIRMQWRRR